MWHTGSHDTFFCAADTVFKAHFVKLAQNVCTTLEPVVSCWKCFTSKFSIFLYAIAYFLENNKLYLVYIHRQQRFFFFFSKYFFLFKSQFYCWLSDKLKSFKCKLYQKTPKHSGISIETVKIYHRIINM